MSIVKEHFGTGAPNTPERVTEAFQAIGHASEYLRHALYYSDSVLPSAGSGRAGLAAISEAGIEEILAGLRDWAEELSSEPTLVHDKGGDPEVCTRAAAAALSEAAAAARTMRDRIREAHGHLYPLGHVSDPSESGSSIPRHDTDFREVCPTSGKDVDSLTAAALGTCGRTCTEWAARRTFSGRTV